MLTKQAIKNSFSKYAITYDRSSDFQRETGYRLVDKIVSAHHPCGTVLDIGIGTGRVTQELARRLNTVIYGCDIAWGMVAFSKAYTHGLCISQADAECLPYRSGVFDTVFSNIAYQWVKDIRKAFLEVRRVLQNKGRFYFSILVRGSLKELYTTLNVVLKRDFGKDLLPASECIQSELEGCGLRIGWYEEAILKRYYASSFDLIKTLQSSGAGRVSGPNLFGMGKREQFFTMLDAYNRSFSEHGKVYATYTVFSGCAQKE